MRAYDEFDNLVFEKDGEIIDEKDRKAFIDEVWKKLDEADTARMEIELEKVGKMGSRAGNKMRELFAEAAEIETTKVPSITGATVGKKDPTDK